MGTKGMEHQVLRMTTCDNQSSDDHVTAKRQACPAIIIFHELDPNPIQQRHNAAARTEMYTCVHTTDHCQTAVRRSPNTYQSALLRVDAISGIRLVVIVAALSR
jgi:hypothetical protein